MLILSQHKIVILNFNTTTTIIADKNEIIARLINGNKATLGKYATEKRAKEVLREILERYNVLKKNTTYTQGDSSFTFNEHYYHEMPKE